MCWGKLTNPVHLSHRFFLAAGSLRPRKIRPLSDPMKEQQNSCGCIGPTLSTRLFTESCARGVIAIQLSVAQLIEHGLQAANSGKGELVLRIDFHCRPVGGKGAGEVVF